VVEGLGGLAPKAERRDDLRWGWFGSMYWMIERS
jgi:hypothetical protein